MQSIKITHWQKLFATFTAYPQIMRRLCGHLLWITLLMIPLQAVNANQVRPQIVVSVAPLQGIVQDLWPQANVQVLTQGSEDFHHFQWQPAQLALVQQADWVVWLGPQQEPALASTFGRLPSDKVVTLFKAEKLSATRHDDIHLWLDPAAVAQMLTVLGERWQRQSLAQQQQNIQQQFWQRWQQRFSPLAKQPFAIQHDAIGSWVKLFGLTQALAITSDHEHEPGVQQLWQMRQQLQQSPVVCYVQTQAQDAWWPKISAPASPPVKTTVLDLFGNRDYPPVDGSHYLGFMQQALEKLEACLMPRFDSAQRPAGA